MEGRWCFPKYVGLLNFDLTTSARELLNFFQATHAALKTAKSSLVGITICRQQSRDVCPCVVAKAVQIVTLHLAKTIGACHFTTTVQYEQQYPHALMDSGDALQPLLLGHLETILPASMNELRTEWDNCIGHSLQIAYCIQERAPIIPDPIEVLLVLMPLSVQRRQ